MRTSLLAGVATIVLGTSLAHGDALMLLANARTVQDDAPKAKSATVEYSTGFYMRTGVGANLMTNVNSKSDSGAYHMDAGIDVNASIGYRFTKIIGLEVQSGFTWNAFNSFSQGSKPEVGVSGQLYQVPIAANFVVTVPLSEGNYEPIFGRGAELLVLAGGGGQWGNGDMRDATGTQEFTLDDWTWRFQTGLALNAHLATNAKFGVYFMYSRTGDLTGTISSTGADYSLAGLNNFAVGLNFSIRF